ncbi:hypothetical protein LXL04_034224 [Taraxacum kok-saghyz]
MRFRKKNGAVFVSETGSHLGNHVRFFEAPVQVKPKYEEKDKGRPRMNEQISSQMFARRLNVDLVEVQQDAKPRVCKLMDYNKEMYLRQVKEKEQTK